MDVSQYLGIFLDETNEHLQTLSDQLMILENEPENEDTINEIFRAAHSLKGMAGTMGYKRMQNLTHDMENVFSEVRNGKIKVDGHMVDILFQALDALEEYRENISENQDEVSITFIDSGIPYDPLAREDPNVRAPAEEREIGGLGIFMTRKLVDDASYEYKNGQNILTLKKKL